MTPALPLRTAAAFVAVAIPIECLRAQDPVDLRLEQLERQNRELRERVDAMSHDFERIDLGGVVPPLGPARRGVGQGAAKVYDVPHGLSLGGYGEFLFQQRSGRADQADAQRVILYAGYRFDERWVFNSEIEFEHATTADGSGEVSVEFGYLDYLHSEAFNLRAGQVLSPMGLINEMHEPTAFPSASRPQTETRIIPSTWRDLGVGGYGDVGGFSYRAYLMTSLDGAGFSRSGLRGGRQQGSKAEADDWSAVGRLDYVAVPGLVVGGSAMYGDTGQDNLDEVEPTPNRIPDLRTTILEAHVDCRTGPWQLRALFAQARVQDAAAFNSATGVGLGTSGLADHMRGYYAEMGYDLSTWFAGRSGAQLVPFVRYEHIDTQASVPTGYVVDRTKDNEVWTFGVAFKPIPQIVIKLDLECWDDDNDRCNILFGYVF